MAAMNRFEADLIIKNLEFRILLQIGHNNNNEARDNQWLNKIANDQLSVIVAIFVLSSK